MYELEVVFLSFSFCGQFPARDFAPAGSHKGVYSDSSDGYFFVFFFFFFLGGRSWSQARKMFIILQLSTGAASALIGRRYGYTALAIAIASQ